MSEGSFHFDSDGQRRLLLDFILEDDIDGVKAIQLADFNWNEPHFQIGLDEKVSPLACAAYLSRSEIVEWLLRDENLNLDLATVPNQFSPLCAACI